MKTLIIALTLLALPISANAVVLKKPPAPPAPPVVKVEHYVPHHNTVQVAGACHKVISMPDNTSQIVCSYPEQVAP